MILLLAIGLILTWLCAFSYILHAILNPPRRTYASALARGRAGDPSEVGPDAGGPLEFTDWSFSSRDATLAVWDVKGLDPNGPLVVLTHGWGDSRVGALTRVGPIARISSRVILWDLPGNGDSTGKCSLGLHETSDLLNLLSQVNAGSVPIVLMGWSMGAGLSIHAGVVSPVPIHAVIAEAPYRLAKTPAANMLRTMGLPVATVLDAALLATRLLRSGSWHDFDRALWASKLKCPLLVIHGSDDDICPLGDGRSIAQAAPNHQIIIVPDAGHTGLWTQPGNRSICIASVEQFILGLSAPTSGV